jgi:hypothetical protein
MSWNRVIAFLGLGACSSGGDDSDPADTDTQGSDTDVEFYACGWPKLDPGNLVSTGSGIGDVVADWGGTDACGERYSVWDGYGRYMLVLSPVFW